MNEQAISKRKKILLEICSKIHGWIFFLCSHDFCLYNSPEWSNSFPMKKNIKTFAPWYSQEKYFCQMWLHGTSGIYGFCLTKWSMTSQRLENLQLWADSDDRRARHTLFPSQISYKACAYYLVFYIFWQNKISTLLVDTVVNNDTRCPIWERGVTASDITIPMALIWVAYA